MAQEQGFWQHGFFRRDLPKYTVATGAVLKTIFEAACAPNPPRPVRTEATRIPSFTDEANLFPEDEFLTQRHFNQDMYQKLIDVSESFPEVKVEIAQNQRTRIDLMQALSTRRDIVDKTKIAGIGFYQDKDGELNIELVFTEDVDLGREFSVQSTSPSQPVLIFIRKDDRVTTSGSHDFQAYVALGDSRQRIGYMNLPFPVPIERIADADLLVIFNKGFFGHQPNRAVPLPVKFKMAQSRGVI